MKEISLNILDIVENSITAGSSMVKLEVVESKKRNLVYFKISDNGKGIPQDQIDQVTDPYVTSRITRKTGMGIPLLKYHAESAGGRIKISSEQEKGTQVSAWFAKDHVDRQPIGDLPGILKHLLRLSNQVEFIFRYETDIGKFDFSSEETKKVLEIKSLCNNQLLSQLEELIHENLMDINAELT